MNTVTIVSQLINEAQLRFGGVEALEIPETLWERASEEVADAGGELGLDHFTVDGVPVRISPRSDDTVAVVHCAEAAAPQELPITEAGLG